MAGDCFRSSPMSKNGFGEYLKRERQMRGVSLEEICAATRISTRFLEALENEQWDTLPGGVFNRGFVRAVARFLGLNEEDLVAQYTAAMSEQNATPVFLNQPQQPQTTRSWLPWVGVLAILVLAGGGWLGWRLYSTHRARVAAREAAAAATVTTEPAAPAPDAAASTNPDDATSSAPPSANSSAPTTGATTPSATSELQLKLEAGQTTAVTVAADGEKIFEGSLIAGQSRTFMAQSTFEVSVQDAGALLLEPTARRLLPSARRAGLERLPSRVMI